MNESKDKIKANPSVKKKTAQEVWPNTVLNDGKPKRSYVRQAGPTPDGSFVEIHQYSINRYFNQNIR